MKRLDEVTQNDPTSHDEFLRWNEAMALLTGEIDFAEEEDVETLAALIPGELQTASGATPIDLRAPSLTSRMAAV